MLDTPDATDGLDYNDITPKESEMLLDSTGDYSNMNFE